MIKRSLVVFVTFVSFVCFLAFSAFAAGVDYNDYITNVRVDGDNDIVTVSLPTDHTYFILYDSSWNVLSSYVGSSFELDLNSDSKYQLEVEPFTSCISLDNIPDGTTISFKFSCSNSGSYTTPDIFGRLVYYSDGSRLSYKSSNFGRAPFSADLEFSFVMDVPLDADSFTPSVVFEDWSVLNSGYPLTVECTELVLQMTISSLYRLQQSSGKTNQILSEVEKQLADQGKTLDEVLGAQQDTNDKLDNIINGTVSPSSPSGSGAVGDLDNAESQIRDDAQSGLDQGLEVQQSALQVLAQYWSGFACVGWIFNRFSGLPFFSGLLYVSFALGITGSILGLGLSISRSGSHAGKDKSKARSKGG